MSSTNFKVRVSVNDNGGDSTSSQSFQMLGSVGQPSIDTMTSTSFVSKNGFIYNLYFGTDSLVITAPNGGEKWLFGTVKNITWTTAGSVPNIKIEYSTNGGLSFPYLIATTSNTGSYAWTVPDSIGGSVRIRVSDSDVPSAFDVSDGDFSIHGLFTLTRPEGGDSFQAGTTETVTWTSTGTISAVKLEFSTDSGITWSTIIASTANTGSYLWTVPNIGTPQAKVRVSLVADISNNDTSNDVFRINGDTLVTVTLVNPANGYETTATTIQFQWATTNDADTYTWQLSKDSTFGMILDSVVDTTATSMVRSVASNDSYYWRVTGRDRFGNYDTAVRGFVIDTFVGKVVLTTPTNTSVTIVSTPTLAWTALADSVGIDSYIVEISNSPTFTSTVFVDTVSKTSDTVSPGLMADTYFWRVRAIDHLQNIGAYSDSFTIVIDTTHTLTVTAPNGGQVWTVGETRTITWTATGVISNVKLEFSTDSGSTFPNRITDSTANTGSYAWLIPDSIGVTTRVKISDVVDSTITDSSDANFTIRGGLTITRPNGGDSFQAGMAENITWTNTGTITSVRLEYSVDSGVTWSVIVSSTSNTGTYLWTVPNVNTAQAKVRVMNAADTATNDTSDDVFRINPVVVLPPPDTILISAGNHALGTPSSSLPLTIRVVDTGGSNGVLGARVTFTVTQGSGSLSSPTVYTDATGYATDTITLGTSSGVYRVEARNDSVPGRSVVFTEYVDGRDVPPGGNTLGQGWRMVGVNKNPSGWNFKSTSGGLPSATVYEWLPDQPDVSGLNNTKYYSPSGDAVRGRAYWIKDASGGRVFVPSDGIATAETVQVRLNVGWNQVASGQYFYVSWDSGVAFDTSAVNDTMLPVNQRLNPAQAGASSVIQNKIYHYTGSNYIYGPASETPSLTTIQMKTMVGFWLKVNTPCTMYVYPNPASPETYAGEILNQAPAYLSANYGQVTENEWAIQLIATAGGISDWQNYIGSASSSQKRHSASALEAPPVAAGYVTLAVREPGEKDWMAAAYGGPLVTGKTWDVMVSSDLGPLTVSWDNVQNLPTQYEAYLVGSGVPVNLRKASSVLVTSSATLTLAVGLPEYVAPFLASPLSKEQTFAYPNPAADVVTFKYNLQSAGDVTVRIFDVGGRLVRELKGSGIAGSNTLTWDTTNKNGQKVGSGVYIYIMEGAGNKFVDKLAIIR